MAKRLIDVDAAVERLSFEGVMQYPQSWGMGVLAAISTIRSLPTVDAVEVCYCKDCKHLRTGGKAPFFYLFCLGHDGAVFRVEPDNFCSYGERKDGGQAPQREDV